MVRIIASLVKVQRKRDRKRRALQIKVLKLIRLHRMMDEIQATLEWTRANRNRN
uniref:Uncharacterized protein n=1 Tax=Tetranychus urticae TaxID=32264 RepID=T1KM69_TETUR